MDNKKAKYNNKSYLVFLAALFCFVFMPALILSYTTYRYYKIEEERLIIDLKTYTQHVLSELRRNLFAEDYFANLFYEYNIKEINNKNSNIDDSILFCKKLKDFFGNNIDFVVLNNNAEIKYNSKPEVYNYSKKDWFDGFCYIKSMNGLTEAIRRGNNKGNIEALRKIFGPQVTQDSFGFSKRILNYNLFWADSSGHKLPGSCSAFRWGGIFVFVTRELLEDFIHLKFNIIEYASNKKYVTGLCEFNKKDDDIWSNKKLENHKEIKDAIYDLKAKGDNFAETYYYYICYHPLLNDIGVFTIINKNNTFLSLWFKLILVILLYFAFSLPIIRYFWNTIVLQKPGEASIKLKLAFLFFFATGIPLILCAVVSREYELYRKECLIKEAQIWSKKKILEIEERYDSFLKYLCVNLDKTIDKWAVNLKDKELDNDYSQKLYKKVNDFYGCDYILVASNTKYVAARDGFFRYTGSLDSIHFDLSKSIFVNHFGRSKEDIDSFLKMKIKDYEVANMLIKKITSDFNGTQIPSMVLNKLEFIGESLWQKPFSEITYDVFTLLGNIKSWGLGNKMFMSFAKVISVYDKSKIDFFILLLWFPTKLQDGFLFDFIPKINRNSLNFKFIVYEKYDRFFIPDKYAGNYALERFAESADIKPTEEQVILNIDGEDYLAISMLGQKLDRYSLIGLYPIKNIELEIKNQSSWLSILGVFCLLLSLGLAHRLARSFIDPLVKLQEGAIAIEKRNFEHRLSGLGIDEFGQIGGIFNDVMVGLEELGIAKIVQESLLPKNEFQQGRFSVYGKCVTMIDIGGDYFDFFKVDDNHFSLLIGDVAGHGVGAAVIMAMAKAYILNAGEDLRSPAKVLNSLHKIILGTKNSRQKKIMTFQYMYINSETGENLYGNAGGCSPLLVRSSERSVEEIKMIGSTLGAFKNSVYKEMPLGLKQGDVLVFYTDGIVECSDKNGEMFGYDRLKKTLLDCWDENPEVYYNNIYKTYQNFVGQEAEARDDLTIVIMRCNEENGIQEAETLKIN